MRRDPLDLGGQPRLRQDLVVAVDPVDSVPEVDEDVLVIVKAAVVLIFLTFLRGRLKIFWFECLVHSPCGSS